MSSDFDRICVPGHTFEFFENLMWISHILVFFLFDFQSHRSQSLEGAERAVWMCMEISVSILVFFRKSDVEFLYFGIFFDCFSWFWF